VKRVEIHTPGPDGERFADLVAACSGWGVTARYCMIKAIPIMATYPAALIGLASVSLVR
jgi:hypothetical protein